jgi:hypothetical protein
MSEEAWTAMEDLSGLADRDAAEAAARDPVSRYWIEDDAGGAADEVVDQIIRVWEEQRRAES